MTAQPPPKPRNSAAIAATVGAILVVLGFGSCGLVLAQPSGHSLDTFVKVGLGLMAAGLLVLIVTAVSTAVSALLRALRK